MGTVANTADGIDIQKWSDFPEDGIEFDWTRLINHIVPVSMKLFAFRL